MVVVSVKQKIILTLWLITFLVVAFAGGVASAWFYQDQTSRLDEFLSHEARSVQDTLDTFLAANTRGSSMGATTTDEFRVFLRGYFLERQNRPLAFKTTTGVFDAHGNLVQASNLALNLTSELVPSPPSLILITVEGHPAYRMAVATLTRQGQVVGELRMACLTSAVDGAWASFLVSVFLVLGLVFVGFGSLGTALIQWSFHPVREMARSARDISEAHLNYRLTVPSGKDEISQMALTLNRMLDQLERDFGFEEALVGQLSHELRTPLTILRGRNEVTLERLPADQSPVRQLLEDNIADIDQIVSLLNTLLRLARLEGKLDATQRVPCNLVDILRELLDELGPLWDEKDLEFQLRFPDAAVVDGDVILLRQVFLNILTNAYKYAPRSSQIHLAVESLESDGPWWVVTFHNAGPAIPEDSLELVFKRFYRVEVQNPDEVEKQAGLGQRGFGLGLSIARSMVELHEGKIRAYNPASGGAAFEVRLPRHNPELLLLDKKRRSA